MQEPNDLDPDDLLRRVRYWLGQGESALELATAALSRVGELSPEWSQEFGSDAEQLRSKLTVLTTMINGK
jgi:hypothetical protein